MSGRLGDSFGPKPVLLAGLAGFTLASVACALAPDPGFLILARAGQGATAALIAPQGMSLVVHLIPQARRGALLGALATFGGVSTAAGPLVGGVLVAAAGWQWIFLINIPIGILAWVAALVLLHNPPLHQRHWFDVLGVVLSAAGLFALVFALQSGEQYDWGTIAGPVSIGSVAVAGVVCLGLFVVWQHKNPHEPLVPLRIFANRNFSAASTAGFAAGTALGGLLLPLMIYLQHTLGYSALRAGAATIPLFAGFSWSARLAGRASDTRSPAVLVATGFAAIGAGVGVLVWLLDPGLTVWLLMPPLLLVGVGVGLVSAPLASIGTRTVPADLIGAASGVFNTTRQVGAATGSAATGVILQAGIGPEPHHRDAGRAAVPHPDVAPRFRLLCGDAPPHSGVGPRHTAVGYAADRRQVGAHLRARTVCPRPRSTAAGCARLSRS